MSDLNKSLIFIITLLLMSCQSALKPTQSFNVLGNMFELILETENQFRIIQIVDKNPKMTYLFLEDTVKNISYNIYIGPDRESEWQNNHDWRCGVDCIKLNLDSELGVKFIDSNSFWNKNLNRKVHWVDYEQDGQLYIIDFEVKINESTICKAKCKTRLEAGYTKGRINSIRVLSEMKIESTMDNK